MEGLIIWLIILAVVIYNSTKKAKAKNTPQNYQQQSYRQQPVQQAQRYQTGSNGKPNMTQMQADMARKQQELKKHLQQKYAGTAVGTNVGAAQQNAPYRAAQQTAAGNVPQQKAVQKKNDIMSRAAANVKENEVDKLANSGELMSQVNDLMIMGYPADLRFERDFVAEGIDMLNSYEIPKF